MAASKEKKVATLPNDTSQIKDASQLQMEALEAELGEDGMKKVEDYLSLQASLPDVVKASPYSWIAFAATDKESQAAYVAAIDESNLGKEDKEKLKADLQDIWNRYPEKFTAEDNLALSSVSKIMEERFIKENSESIGIKWYSTPHQDFAFYACDGSSYRTYARDAADDPDASGFDPYAYRYYNHYEDAFWGIGGAPSRCDEFADSAIFAINNGYYATAHQRFGYSSHYLSDVGIPFHSKGAIDYLGGFVDALFNAAIHNTYESYVSSNWSTGYNFKSYVSGNTQKITVTNPEQAVEDNADYSAQYYDYIKNKMTTSSTWRTDITLNYYTAQCVQKTARYNHGLYDYIML
jgi:hypothetical protein